MAMARSVLLHALVVAVLAVLAGCSGDASETDGQTSIGSGSAGIATSYIQKCGGCHGAIGSDQAAESLPNVSGLDKEAIEAKIRSGGPQMPAFDASLSSGEIDALATYVADNF